MEITSKQQKKNITPQEAKTRLDFIRKDVEQVFFNYEKINPPSSYQSQYLQILQLLTHLQEVVTSNLEYLSHDDYILLEESLKLLENFRQEYHSIRREIESIT
jgi:hypothetical protein